VIASNVVLGHISVDGQELSHAGRLGEKIRGMAELRGLYDHDFLKVVNVF
jgi:hypothetical protein